jgi:hypothetical protein
MGTTCSPLLVDIFFGCIVLDTQGEQITSNLLIRISLSSNKAE